MAAMGCLPYFAGTVVGDASGGRKPGIYQLQFTACFLLREKDDCRNAASLFQEEDRLVLELGQQFLIRNYLKNW